MYIATEYTEKQKNSSAICTEDDRDIIKDVILEILCIHYLPFAEGYHHSIGTSCSVFSFTDEWMNLLITLDLNPLLC